MYSGLKQTSADSTVRILSLSRFVLIFRKSCPVSVWQTASAVRILSGIFEKTLSVVCLPDRTSTRQSCPDFRCPCPPTSGLKSLVKLQSTYILNQLFIVRLHHHKSNYGPERPDFHVIEWSLKVVIRFGHW